SLDKGLVYVDPEGGVWVKLNNIHGNPIMPDTAFLHALPETLSKACTNLGLHDPVSLNTELVIKTDGLGAPPVVYWDGQLSLRDAALKAGVDLDHVSGIVACKGLYNGQRLEDVAGNVALDEMTVFKQPFRAVHGQFEVKKDAPDILVSPGL